MARRLRSRSERITAMTKNATGYDRRKGSKWDQGIVTPKQNESKRKNSLHAHAIALHMREMERRMWGGGSYFGGFFGK